MATEVFEFINGNESSTQPGVGSPAASAYYDQSWTAETFKTEDVSVDGINAEQAVGFLLDADNSYRRLNAEVYPTSSTTMRVETAIALTGNYRLIVIGVG